VNNNSKLSLAIAFLAAVVFATVWGAIVQTQFNVSALNGIGADISGPVRMQTTLRDIFSGFTPTYGGYVVLPSLLVAFVVASWIHRRMPGPRWTWFAAAGGVAILLGNPVVNFISPLALLVGATRDLSCLIIMALGGVAAGMLFTYLYRAHGRDREAPAGKESFAR
jgi:hypothetical protein